MKWDERVKATYGDIIGLIGFIVTVTADQGADIAIRALPILAPLPNAISVFYVSGDTLGFGYYQSLFFATAIELSMFGLFEGVLKQFDGLQINPELYKWPFRISAGVAVVIMALVMIVVWWLETKHRILSFLPLFSAAGAIALVMRRWHERNMNDLAVKKASRKSVRKVSGKNTKENVRAISKTADNTEKKHSPTGEEKLFDILDREQSGDLPKQKRSELHGQLGMTRTRMYELIKQWSLENPSVRELPETIAHMNGANHKGAL